MKAIAYYRVSTEKQGRSGLELEAQNEAARTYLKGRGWPRILSSPKWRAAIGAIDPIASCTGGVSALSDLQGHDKGTLVIAKVDRLARNAAFLLCLPDAGVDFVCCDMPDANRLTVGIMALVAEDEA